MTKKDFKQKWEQGLKDYLAEISKNDSIPRTNGFTRYYKNGDPAIHEYIINIADGDNEIDLVKKYNVLWYPNDFEKLIKKVHQYARHLNSSQVMCFNFFRNMMKEEIVDDKTLGCYGFPSSKLINFVKEMVGVEIFENAKCIFEYEDLDTKNSFKSLTTYKGLGEKSQFDFYISDSDINIYFEIKYTETEFGSWAPSKETSDASKQNHKNYLKDGYLPKLDKNPYFTKSCKDSIQKQLNFTDPKISFNKSYQLFRNALKADGKNNYSVFIFPDANLALKQEFDIFKKYFEPGQDHIKALSWESLSLTKYMANPFFDKYFSFI